MFGPGSVTHLVLTFGGVSGGADAGNPKIRRVGLAITCFSQVQPHVIPGGSNLGPLRGKRQVAAR
eukprot:6072973-Pyramimonas_sp.AAC.1